MSKDIYNPIKIEEEIRNFWKEREIYKKIKEKNKGGRDFYFLDGPPYANGKIHLGTAWNKVLKDAVLRYKRKKGFNVFDRAGYDMHGLPIETVTEKKLELKNKEDIQKIGEKKFIEACRKLALENLQEMNKGFKKLGVWMDFENAYRTIDRSFILGEWWLIKKAYQEGRLYEANKTMHWCAHCGTALAKHELEYKTVKDKSIFIKIKTIDNRYLLVWTTTPWTLPFNTGVMVNPEMDYVEIEVENERWIICKALMNAVVGGILGKEYKILREFKGKELEGLKYNPIIDTQPLREAVKDSKKPENNFTVVLSEEYVTPTAGTGLVHCAPGCGPEDYEVGYRYGLAIFNNIDENGNFPESMDWLSGLKAKKDDKKIIEKLKEKGILLAIEEVEHEYAHCWRCKEPVIFRTTKQWFFKIEDLKPQLLEFNNNTNWIPEWAGRKQFKAWLENLRDNTITRQRYWGSPVPIWRCECGHYEVIGNDEDAERLGGKLPEDLHKPEIDKVILKCPKCGGEMKRIPDVLDVWIDAGTASWNALEFPTKKDLFEKLYPTEFILEGKDQIRGWFNLLMIASAIAFKKPAFKNCYMHGFINDAKGRKMSKSLQNYILPEEVIEKYGVDTFRYYFIGGADPGTDINYNEKDTQLHYRNLSIIWNIARFIIDTSESHNLTNLEIKPITEDTEDVYLLSITEKAIKEATEAMEAYKINVVPKILGDTLLAISREYIQISRTKIEEKPKEKLGLLLYTYLKLLNAFSIITPFITEKIYQKLKKRFNIKGEESIHLMEWPKIEKEIDEKVIEKIKNSLTVISLVNNAREKIKIKRRWPIKRIIVITKKEIDEDVVKRIGNAKEILKVEKDISEIKEEYKNLIKVEEQDITVYIDKEMDQELKEEAIKREIIRHIQMLRKKKEMVKKDRIILYISHQEYIDEESKKKAGIEKIESLKEGEEDKINVFGKEIKLKIEKINS